MRTAWHVTLSIKTTGPRRRNLLGALFVAGTPVRLHLTDEQKAELEATGDWTFRPAADPEAAAKKRPARPPLAPPVAPEPSTPTEPTEPIEEDRDA